MLLLFAVEAGTPVALSQDYEPYEQGGKFDNYSVMQNQFLARGHLSPNGDFSKELGENSFTYVTTNIAPQWQPFNMGNWVVVETAVQRYAKQKQGRTLYIFTGTGGYYRFDLWLVYSNVNAQSRPPLSFTFSEKNVVQPFLSFKTSVPSYLFLYNQNARNNRPY